MVETVTDITELLAEGGSLALPEAPKSSVFTLAESIEEALEFYGTFSGKKPDLRKSGMRIIDEHLGGLHPKQLAILSARPGVGKSTLALYFGITAAASGTPVGYVPLEDPVDLVGARAIGMAAKIDDRKIRLHNQIGAEALTVDEINRMQQAKARVGAYPFYIASPSASDLGSVIRAMDEVARRGAQVVWVDYIQRIRFSASSDERRAIDNAIDEMESWSRDYNIALVLLSQLNRPDKGRKEYDKPEAHRLKGSGALEERARLIVSAWQNGGQTFVSTTKSTVGDPTQVQVFQRVNGVLREI